MSRQKKTRFKEIAERYNVIERQTERFEKLRGNWKIDHFKNNNPINLELACGRGEYTVGLAKHFPDENFIGIDIKGERLWKGSTESLNHNLENTAFLRTFALDLEQSFESNEIKDIWIIHPDPRPRDRDEKRRLTHDRFLDIYKKIQENDGTVYFKTDNTDLFQWTLDEVLSKRDDIKNLVYTFDLKNSELLEEHYGITTKYEKKFEAEGEKIKYMKFQWKV
jgi:tRNA (guanine-N7-)-methyltransferase